MTFPLAHGGSRWHLTFNDPDPLGWATTFAYFAAAALCVAAGRREARGRTPGAAGVHPKLWLVMAAALVLLGVNKQLDLQFLLREKSVALLHRHGWQGHRSWLGRWVVILLATSGAAAAVFVARRLGRGGLRRYALALAGAALLGCFLVLRAGAYAPYLADINYEYFGPIHLVMELGSLLVIALAAARALRPARRAQNPPPA